VRHRSWCATKEKLEMDEKQQIVDQMFKLVDMGASQTTAADAQQVFAIMAKVLTQYQYELKGELTL